MGGLAKFWKDYKVLIVMGTSLGLIHWGWYEIKNNPLLKKQERDDFIPIPGIVAFVAPDLPPSPPVQKVKVPAPAKEAKTASE